MALQTTRNKAEINRAGGDIFKVVEVNEDNTVLSSPDTPHDLGEVKEYTLINKPSFELIKNVLGKTVLKFKKDVTIGFKATLLQSSKNIYNISVDADGKFYQGYHYNGIVNNKYQEFFWASGNLTLGNGEVKYQGGEIEVEFEALPNDNVATMAASSFSAYCGSGSLSATTISIPAKQGFTIVETSITAV